MKLAALLGNARFRLLGPLAPGPYVRVEGCEMLGQQGAPVLKLYLWVETPQANPAVRELRVQVVEPHRDSAHVDVRERRHEDAIVSFPLDGRVISPRLTVFGHLTRPLPGARGLVEGRVGAVGRPGTVLRWTPFRCIYRWDVQPVAPIESAPEVEASPAQEEPAEAAAGDQKQVERANA